MIIAAIFTDILSLFVLLFCHIFAIIFADYSVDIILRADDATMIAAFARFHD